MGFWSTMHESRADLTMLLGCIYLAIVGARKWSLDDRLAR
jgi:putative oxidoreductase